MITVTAEELRNRWGATMERVMAAGTMIIQRYGRPALVLMTYAKYQELEQRARMMDDPCAVEERNTANGTWISHEELKAKLEAKAPAHVERSVQS